MFDKFSSNARRVIQLSRELAALYGYEQIEPEHVLHGITCEKGSLGTQLLEGMDIPVDNVKEWIEERLESSPPTNWITICFSDQSKEMLESAVTESIGLGHNYAGTEHMILAIFSKGSGEAFGTLNEFIKITVEELRKKVDFSYSSLSHGRQIKVGRNFPYVPYLNSDGDVETRIKRLEDVINSWTKLNGTQEPN